MRPPCKLVVRKDDSIIIQETYRSQEDGQSEFLSLLRYYKINPESIVHRLSSTRESWSGENNINRIHIKLKVPNEKI